MGDCVVSALLTTQRGLPPTALPRHHPSSPLPRQMMLRKRHSSSGQLLSELSDPLPRPDNLRPRGVSFYRVSCAASQPPRHPVSQPVDTFWFSLPRRISCLLLPQHLELHPQTCRHLKAGSEEARAGQMVAPVTLCFALPLNKQQQSQSLSSLQQIFLPSRGQMDCLQGCPAAGSPVCSVM